MESADTLTDLESRIAAAGRELIGYRGQIGPDTSVNFDMGIVGDDGDMLSGEIIASTGLAIGPDLQRLPTSGRDGSPGIANRKRGSANGQDRLVRRVGGD